MSYMDSMLQNMSQTKPVEDKRKRSAGLSAELEKFLKSGGEIKQAETEKVVLVHGKPNTYKRFGCRCDKCSDWYLSQLSKNKKGTK